MITVPLSLSCHWFMFIDTQPGRFSRKCGVLNQAYIENWIIDSKLRQVQNCKVQHKVTT